MLKRSVFSTASLARVLPLRYCTRPMPARTTRTDATTRSSMRVKPRSLRSRVVSSRQSPVVSRGERLSISAPLRVLRAVERRQVGSACDVEDAGRRVRVARIRLACCRLPGGRAERERILGNLPEVARAHEIIECRWPLTLVRVVLIDRVAHVEEVCFQHGFARARLGVPILHEADAREDDQNRRDDEELDEGKAEFAS